MVQRVRGPQAVAAAGCTITSHGFTDLDMSDPVDLNGNGIPGDLYLKYVCIQTDSVGGDTVETQSASEEVAIKEITASLYGQTISFVVSQEMCDNHGSYAFIRYNIDGLQDIRASGVTDKASLKVRLEANTTGDVVFHQAEQSFNNSFDPGGTITLHADIPNDALTFDLDYRFVASGDEGSAAIRFTMVTTDPLDLDNTSCYGQVDGTIVGDLNGDADVGFTIDWSACDTPHRIAKSRPGSRSSEPGPTAFRQI